VLLFALCGRRLERALSEKTILLFLMAAVLFAGLPDHTRFAFGESDTYIYSGITFFSPLNRTYAYGHLALNLTLYSAGMMGSIDPRISMNYSIDGKLNGSVPLTISNPGLHVVTNAAGFVNLPELPEGSHVLTIYLLGHNQKTANPKYVPYVESVYFYVGSVPPDTRPPETWILSPLENEIFMVANITAVSIPLNFTIDENAARLAFSLDGHPNTTIAGNASLTELSAGPHNVTVYAWDSAGNVGASTATNFTIAQEPKPEVFPVVPVALAAIAVVAFSAAGLVFTRKKRQKDAMTLQA